MKKKWSGLTQYIAVTRKVGWSSTPSYRDKKGFEKTTYYITNTDLSAYRLGKTIRAHRKIENRGGVEQHTSSNTPYYIGQRT